MAEQIPGFVEETFTAAEYTRTIFRKGSGPGVILMHKLPGLTCETVSFAEWIAAQGFHVVLPLLFGRALQGAALGIMKSVALCLRKEFNCFGAGRASPITDWLRPLCAKVHADCGGPGVGVIGMCFTGGFVLTMMVEEAVMAPVAAQPSLPLFRPAELDVDPGNLVSAVARAKRAPLLTMRFEQDSSCPAKRLDRLQQVFGGAPHIRRVDVPGKGHATLTFDFEDALGRSMDPRQEVLQHLSRQLRPH
jgi:dienelactone hydrolase